MRTQDKPKVQFKVWLEHKGEPLIGKGGAEILETIREVESISKAAKKTGMSYRYVWNYLAKLERRLGEPVVNTFKGGSKGGGGATLAELGKELLKEYHKAECYLTEAMSEQMLLKTSERNSLKGSVQTVDTGLDATEIKIKLDSPAVITAVIPKEAAEKLTVKVGDNIEATIKATDITVTKEK